MGICYGRGSKGYVTKNVIAKTFKRMICSPAILVVVGIGTIKGFGPEGASGPRRQPTGPFKGHVGATERAIVPPIPATILSLNAEVPTTLTGTMLLNQVA